MSQIKSYLSLESVPSLEFRTPMKNPIQTLTTNHSMSLSNTLGSLDNKSLWNRRTFYNSHEMEREPIYQAQDFVEERSQQIENNSAVTLSPAITQQDLIELVDSVKMIAFLTQIQQQQSIRIQKKEATVKALKQKIFMLEEQAKFRKRQFEKKEKDIKSRSVSMHSMRRAASKSLQKEIVDLKFEIGQMKRTISQKKATIQSRRSSQEKRHFYPATERKRQKIYVPIVSSPFFAASPPIDSRQRHASYYNGPSAALPSVQPRYINTKQMLHHANAVNISASNSNKGSNKASSKNISKPSSYGPPSARKHPLDTGQLNVLDLIQEKLRMPSGIETSPLQTQIIKSQNPQLLTPNKPGLFQILAPVIRQQMSQNYNIAILKEETKQPNLDYFNQEHDELDLDGELLMHSQQSRKSIRALKQTSKSHTNKWRKDEQDKQIVQMLKESINDSPAKQAQIKIEIIEPPKKTEMGAKLVETNIQRQQSFSIQLAQKSRSRQCSSPERIHNASQVQIFVADLTDERIKNQSGASDQNSDKRLSVKNIERNNFSNSAIGIDINQSLEDCPQLSIESKLKPKDTSPQNIAIDKIEELPQEAFSRTVTPASPVAQFRLTSHLEPSVESRYTESLRETIEPAPEITKEVSMGESHGSSLQKSAPTTPVLSRPPSLLQQQQEDDQSIINSIKLNSNSRHIIQSPSRINKMNQAIESPQEIQSPIEVRGIPEEEQDQLFEIRLNNMSKISRQKGSSQDSIPLKDQDSIPEEINKKMAQSELAPRSSYEDDVQGMEDVESELRKSTNSVIISKKSGSAINRSGARKEVNTLKTSNRVSSLSLKSKEMSSPIEQADQQEEDYNSIIVKKHKRHGTDLEH